MKTGVPGRMNVCIDTLRASAFLRSSTVELLLGYADTTKYSKHQFKGKQAHHNTVITLR